MLQQTQVSRVLGHYGRWVERWPSLAALAAASPAEVIGAWSGLGYNRRALNLHRLALEVTFQHDGRLPVSREQLLTLPGVGTYTAAAVLSFAFERPVAVIDTNVGRVLARAVLGYPDSKAGGVSTVARTAQSLLPAAGSRDHNLALMDLGALVCTSRSPACEACPVSSGCEWRRLGYPCPTARPARTAIAFEETARFARGRIIDALRTTPFLTEDELRATLPERHRDRTTSYLESLRRDGLVECNGDRWSLPGRLVREE